MPNNMMQRAMTLAEKARFHAPPNPWVGCVIVKDNQIIGEGYTQPYGGAHAEAEALSQATAPTKGATAYVTLEPCSHHGKTKPCSQALIDAGISHVIIGTEDPDENVKGQGIAALRQAGIQVDVGIEKEAIERSLTPYLHHRITKRPYCVLKSAVSADGRTAAADGSSQWITGKEARTDVHRLRDASQAIVIGSGTALADRPSLTVRHVPLQSPQQPLRILLDSRGRVPPHGPLFEKESNRTIVLTTKNAPDQAIEGWKQSDAEIVVLPTHQDSTRLDLKAVCHFLGSRGVLQALFEGGATLHHQLFRESLVDKLHLYIGPCLLGPKGHPFLAGAFPSCIEEAPLLKLHNVTRLGDSIRLDYVLDSRTTIRAQYWR